MLIHITRIATLLLAIVLALAAITLTGLRLWAPSLSHYQPAIEAAAATALGASVRVGRVEAGWRGLDPLLVLHDIRIDTVDPAAGAPRVSEIRLRPDLLHFLFTRELRLSGVDLIGVSLDVVRAADGSLHLEGLPFSHAPGSGLAGLRRLTLHRSTIRYTDQRDSGRTRMLSDVTLALQQHIAYLQLHARARLPDAYGERIELAGRLHGSLADPFGWSGRLYLRGQALALGGLRAELARAAPEVRGRADLRCWIDLLVGEPVAWVGEVEVNNLELGTAQAWRVARLGTQFGWRRIENGWQAVLQNAQLLREGLSRAGPRLSVTARETGQGLVLDANAGQLQLADAAAVAAALGPAAGPGGQQLVELQPRGLLHSLLVSVLRSGGATTLQQFDASFSALGIGPAAGWPALDGLDGRVSGAPAAGTLRVETGALHVADATLFRAPLLFDAFDAALVWQRSDTALELSAPVLHLRNADLAVNGSVGLQWPLQGAVPDIDLELVIEHFDVARTGHYLPAGRMSPTGVAWLERSLAGGTVTGGSVLVRGPLDRLPFDHGEGRLEVRLPVSGATLAYNPDWTPVTQLDAQVDFTGRGMDIHSRDGLIRSARLHGVRAVIPDLQHPHLTITGDVRGALPVMLAELGSSPLGETYGGFVDRVIARGTARLGLDLDIPLGAGADPISVGGRIGLADNSLQLRDSDIVLDALGGELAFDDHGIRGDGLSARLFDTPVAAQVWTDDEEPVTYVTLRGELPLVDRVLEAEAPMRARIDGDSEWQVELVARGQPLRGKPADLDLLLRSTLAGTAVELPAPLGKAAGEERQLSVAVRGIERPVHVIEVSYGEQVRADLRVAREGEALTLQRGVVALGGGEPLLPDNRLLLLMGKLERFSLAEWQPLLGQDAGKSDIPVRLSLRLANLELPGHRMRDIGIELSSAGRVYTVRTVGTGAEGEVRFTRNERGLDDVVANLKHLVLEREGSAKGADRSDWQPDSFPDLQFNAGRLVYGETDFGALELQVVKPEPGLLRINRLALSSGLLDLRLTGEWSARQGSHSCSIDLEVNDGRAGDLLDVFGYQQVIKDGRLNGSLSGGWQGTPWEVELKRLQGNLKLILKDGQLLDVDPGAGRVLGLASIASLPRRLRLDFSDLFGKGFGFNRIGGHFILDNGNAWTSDLEIDGPAARIDITGRVGLAMRDYDQQVTVTPYLDSSLPIAGALAGGPAVGAAVLVADKLLEGKLGFNEVARRQYTVTGSWDDPKVTPMATAAAEQDNEDDTDEDFFQ